MNAPLPQHLSTSVEWFTPPEIIEAARKTLGHIALDPASCYAANKIVRADAYYDRNALIEPWWGPLFVNPPGKSKSNPGGQAAWWNKLMEEWYRIDKNWNARWSAVFLGFSLEILQSAQRYAEVWQPLDFLRCIPKRRIRFINGATGLPMKSPTHGNIIVCVSSDQDVKRRFADNFRQFGHVSGLNL